MSRRNSRHFRAATGTTVGSWLQTQQLAYARRLLEHSTRSIEDIALEAGFGSAISLRQHFASPCEPHRRPIGASFEGISRWRWCSQATRSQPGRCWPFDEQNQALAQVLLA